MSALVLAVTIQREVGIETVLHFACRDRNVIGMQSDLLGAWALGLRNILSITGDPPKLGAYPDATAAFNVDSIGLTNLITRLNHGLDLVVCGIWPLVSYRNAEFMNNEVPGASVPREILERMRKAGTKEEAFAEGMAIARETFRRVRPDVAGVQIAAPLGRVETVFTLLGRV